MKEIRLLTGVAITVAVTNIICRLLKSRHKREKNQPQRKEGIDPSGKATAREFSGHPESKNIPLDAPAGTITCVDHHAFVTALHDNGYKSTTKFSSIETEASDSPMTIKIKAFMALYGIIDIRMRMLRIPELKRIMGFSSDYVLVGTQAEQTKFIGNAVEVHQSRALCEALCHSVANKTKQERI